MELRTARLVLREFREEDVDRVFAYESRYDEPPSREEVRRLVQMFCDWAAAVPRTRYQLAITLDAQIIGTCGVRRESEHDAIAELGCELDPDFWGHGYAREASEAILRFSLHELRLERVIARTRADNRAAIRLAEALGLRMTEDGVLVLTR